MTEEEKMERRMHLDDDAIERIVKKTLKNLNGEKDTIAKRATESVIDEINKKSKSHLDFKNDEEKQKFKESIPQLIELNDLVKKTKKRASWVLLLILAWVLQDMFEWVVETGKAIFHWLNVMKNTNGH